jgi:hypothetical protein
MKDQPWKDKISGHAQIGGIETSVLDNGRGRGTRIAWINTGTGLRYKVIIDRSLDIADAFYNQYSLAWLSHVGVTTPNPAATRGLEWLRTFGGGLLSTCGLTHVGAPETDQYGERGLHGRIGNIPAELESIVQPDPVAGNLGMSITGRIRESVVFGPHLELKRTISGTLGDPVIRIRDEVTNLGNTFLKCLAPSQNHLGGGEACVFINVHPDNKGICTCGLHNPDLGLAVAIRFEKNQLPWLTNWQHWGKGEYVTGLEPGTNPPIGQAEARKQDQLIHIEAGESMAYDLELIVSGKSQNINDLLKKQT